MPGPLAADVGKVRTRGAADAVDHVAVVAALVPVNALAVRQLTRCHARRRGEDRLGRPAVVSTLPIQSRKTRRLSASWDVMPSFGIAAFG